MGPRPSPVLLCMQNSVRLVLECTSLYGSQPSSVVLCMQNSVIYDKNKKAIRVSQFITCGLVHAKPRALRQELQGLYAGEYTSPDGFVQTKQRP